MKNESIRTSGQKYPLVLRCLGAGFQSTNFLLSGRVSTQESALYFGWGTKKFSMALIFIHLILQNTALLLPELETVFFGESTNLHASQ